MTMSIDRPTTAARYGARGLRVLIVALLGAAAWGAWLQPARTDYGDLTLFDRLLHPFDTNGLVGGYKHFTSIKLSADGRAAMVVGGHERSVWGGAVYRTDDGGARWRRLTTPTDVHPEKLAMSSDARRAIVICRNGEILRTSDGGATWATYATGMTAQPGRGYMLDSVVLSADGMRGVIVSGDDGRRLLRTDDGGQTWTTHPGPTGYSPTPGPPGQITLAADGRRALLSYPTTVRLTLDGGATWPTSATLPAMTYDPTGAIRAWPQTLTLSSDGRVGLAVVARAALAPDGRVKTGVEHQNLVMRSDDGGATWAGVGNLPSPHTVYLMVSSLTISGEGRRAAALQYASRQFLYVTADGGATWTDIEIKQKPNGSYAEIALSADGLRGVMVGQQDPAILRTNDGGLTWRPFDSPGRSAPYWSYAALAMAGISAVALRSVAKRSSG